MTNCHPPLTSSMLDDWHDKLNSAPSDWEHGECYWMIASKRTSMAILRQGRFRKRSMSNRARRKYRNMKRSRK